MSSLPKSLSRMTAQVSKPGHYRGMKGSVCWRPGTAAYVFFQITIAGSINFDVDSGMSPPDLQKHKQRTCTGVLHQSEESQDHLRTSGTRLGTHHDGSRVAAFQRRDASV